MSWAQRLKRVFRIDIESGERCGGKVRIIASIEDAAVIGQILAHLEQREGASSVLADDALAHGRRGPPRQREFGLGSVAPACPAHGRGLVACAVSLPQRENHGLTQTIPAAQQSAASLGCRYRGSPASRRAATLPTT
jgi:hypothetical protein